VKKKKVDDKRIEEVILAYANCNLKDNPPKLYKISDVIQNNITGDKDSVLNAEIDYICQIHEFNRIVRKNKKAMDDDYNIAHNAVFNYQNNGCKKRCIFRGRVSNNKNLKCYECFQSVFIKVLSDISKGKEYTDIPEFNSLENSYDQYIQKYYLFDFCKTPPGSTFKYKIVTEVIAVDNFGSCVERLGNLTLDKNPLYKEAVFSVFNGYILEILTGCLVAFLVQDERNRERIKICEQCSKFFIRSKFDDRIRKCTRCSAKPRKSKEYNKEYQKRYREIRKRQKLTAEKEKTIKQYMQGAGISRKEAEKIWKVDHPT
jgi:hypothetical protein